MNQNTATILLALDFWQSVSDTDNLHLEIIRKLAEGNTDDATKLLVESMAHYYIDRYYSFHGWLYEVQKITSARFEVYETRSIIDFEAEVYDCDYDTLIDISGTIDLGTGQIKIREPERIQNHTFGENETYHKRTF